MAVAKGPIQAKTKTSKSVVNKAIAPDGGSKSGLSKAACKAKSLDLNAQDSAVVGAGKPKKAGPKARRKNKNSLEAGNAIQSRKTQINLENNTDWDEIDEQIRLRNIEVSNAIQEHISSAPNGMALMDQEGEILFAQIIINHKKYYEEWRHEDLLMALCISNIRFFTKFCLDDIYGEGVWNEQDVDFRKILLREELNPQYVAAMQSMAMLKSGLYGYIINNRESSESIDLWHTYAIQCVPI